MRVPTILFAAAIAGVASASTIRADRNDADYIALGNSYSFVGSISTNVGGGSATLISDRWVLTAGHMFNGAAQGTVNFGGTNYEIESGFSYPSWELGKNDLGVAKLKTWVTGIAPASFWGGSLMEIGKVATSVGYGTSGTGVTGNTGGYGTKRAFRNVIDGYDQNLWGWAYHGLLIDFDRPDGGTNTFGLIGSSATPLDLEGCATPGDSGGGLFVDVNGKPVLVGVTSYVAWEGADPWASRANNTYGYYGDNNGYSRVADYASWITASTGVQPVPEPGTWVAIGLGALSVIRRGKAKRSRGQ